MPGAHPPCLSLPIVEEVGLEMVRICMYLEKWTVRWVIEESPAAGLWSKLQCRSISRPTEACPFCRDRWHDYCGCQRPCFSQECLPVPGHCATSPSDKVWLRIRYDRFTNHQASKCLWLHALGLGQSNREVL